MPKANPKVAEADAPEIVIEDSKPNPQVASEPVKTETKTVNGFEMTFEDF